MSGGYFPKSAGNTSNRDAGSTAWACAQPPAAAMTKGTASRHDETMMIPFGRSVCATATMPPIATKPITKTAAMICPDSTDIFPSEITFRMYPPARNWYATIVVNAMMSAMAPNSRANFP